MFVLVLNHMHDAKVEMKREVCWAETKEELTAFLAREKVEDYMDGDWGKVYRKDGPLEWFNPPTGNAEGIFKVPDEAEIIRQARAKFKALLEMLPNVSQL